MCRISTSIGIALSTLLFVSICAAQQASTPSPNIRIDGPIIGGDGTKNYVPLWATPNYLLSSAIYQDANKNIGIGTTTPAATLDVNGDINAAGRYRIGGIAILSTDNNLNVFLGYETGTGGTSGSGNTVLGSLAGLANTTGSFNTFVGDSAGGYGNTTGRANVFVGASAGQYSTGDENTFVGTETGFGNTGGLNTFIGRSAGQGNTSGSSNTFNGSEAGANNTTGSGNVFLGSAAGANNTTGNANIYIGSSGPPSGSENNAIRIGVQGNGYGQQNVAYIAGIYGSTVDKNGIPVYVDDNGQLGTVVSSLRFKERVRDMGDSTSALMRLRPVTFLYKPQYAKGERTLQYGLIAEEGAKIYPELVAYDTDGQPYSVRYQYITTMLLNEVQKQYHRAEAEAKVVTSQEQKINELEQRLTRLESLARTQVQTVAQEQE